MEDVSPKLLNICRKRFNEEYGKSKQIQKIVNRVRDGTASIQDASAYSSLVGELLGTIFSEELTEQSLPEGRLFWNIAQAVIVPLIHDNHNLINICSAECQQIAYNRARIGIRVSKPKLNQERLKGLLDDVCAEGIDSDQLSFRLSADVKNISESFYDEFAHDNAELSDSVGLRTKVIRSVASSGCCAWCDSLAGIYDYEEVKPTGSDVWLRHVNCNCDITYSFDRGGQKVKNYRKVTYKGRR